jgi:hypothetical protein
MMEGMEAGLETVQFPTVEEGRRRRRRRRRSQGRRVESEGGMGGGRGGGGSFDLSQQSVQTILHRLGRGLESVLECSGRAGRASGR